MVEIIKKTLKINYFHFILTGFFVAVFYLVPEYILKELFVSVLKSRGYTEITLDIVKTLPMDLTTVLLLIILLIIALFLMLMLFTFCLQLYLKSEKFHHSSIKEIIYMMFKQTLRIIKIRPFIVLLWVLLLISPTSLFKSPSLIGNIDIPQFILSEYDANEMFRMIGMIFTVVLLYLNCRFVFMICLLIDDKQKESILKQSWILTRKQSVKILVGLFLLSMIPTLLFEVSMIFTRLLESYFSSLSTSKYLLILMVIDYFENLIVILCDVLLMVLSSTFIVNYYKKMMQFQDSCTKVLTNRTKVSNQVIIIVTFLVTVGIFALNNSSTTNNFTKSGDIEIVSHRGSSFERVENSLSAFKLSMDERVDLIELDVQLTKQGQVIVMHDANVKRLAGVNKKTIDLSREDLKNITLKNEINERIPTLEEVIKMTKDKTNLMIELKPDKEVPGLEKKVVDLIEKYQITKNVCIKSINLDSALIIKKMNSDIRTGYVISYAVSEYKDIYNNLDFFSIEQSSITSKLVSKLIKNDKDIYIWTVNFSKELVELLKYDIKGIITDHPKQMQLHLKHYENKTRIDTIKEIIFDR